METPLPPPVLTLTHNFNEDPTDSFNQIIGPTTYVLTNGILLSNLSNSLWEKKIKTTPKDIETK